MVHPVYVALPHGTSKYVFSVFRRALCPSEFPLLRLRNERLMTAMLLMYLFCDRINRQHSRSKAMSVFLAMSSFICLYLPGTYVFHKGFLEVLLQLCAVRNQQNDQTCVYNVLVTKHGVQCYDNKYCKYCNYNIVTAKSALSMSIFTQFVFFGV